MTSVAALLTSSYEAPPPVRPSKRIIVAADDVGRVMACQRLPAKEALPADTGAGPCLRNTRFHTGFQRGDVPNPLAPTREVYHRQRVRHTTADGLRKDQLRDIHRHDPLLYSAAATARPPPPPPPDTSPGRRPMSPDFREHEPPFRFFDTRTTQNRDPAATAARTDRLVHGGLVPRPATGIARCANLELGPRSRHRLPSAGVPDVFDTALYGPAYALADPAVYADASDPPVRGPCFSPRRGPSAISESGARRSGDPSSGTGKPKGHWQTASLAGPTCDLQVAVADMVAVEKREEGDARRLHATAIALRLEPASGMMTGSVAHLNATPLLAETVASTALLARAAAAEAAAGARAASRGRMVSASGRRTATATGSRGGSAIVAGFPAASGGGGGGSDGLTLSAAIRSASPPPGSPLASRPGTVGGGGGMIASFPSTLSSTAASVPASASTASVSAAAASSALLSTLSSAHHYSQQHPNTFLDSAPTRRLATREGVRNTTLALLSVLPVPMPAVHGGGGGGSMTTSLPPVAPPTRRSGVYTSGGDRGSASGAGAGGFTLRMSSSSSSSSWEVDDVAAVRSLPA